jgi:GMP synthase (glutamine-hydrolysing)
MLYTLKTTDQSSLAVIEEEKKVRKTSELFLLFTLGSQFDHLIKVEIEKHGVFCLVADPASVTADDVKKVNPTGIILSGGPVSVYDKPPPFDKKIFDLGIPVLGICLGFQLWAQHIGVKVVLAEKREFGTFQIENINTASALFVGLDSVMIVLESHGDIIEVNDNLNILGETINSPVAAANHKHLWGLQFHPEVTETEFGSQIFENFIFRICKAKDRFPAVEMAEQKIDFLADKIKANNVLLALSGGSDSSTCAYLLKEAYNKLGDKASKITAVYIKGIDRPDDEEHVMEYFDNQPWLKLVIFDATNEFLDVLKGKETMKEKRIAMRGVYKMILEKIARKYECTVIVQGTLYTDISESGGGYSGGAVKAQIKLHHNVNLEFSDEFEEVLPLSDCVKDSGRNIGRAIGVPENLLTRHPFPGPGLVVRIEGEITEENLLIARHSDEIYIEELRKWNLYYKVWQAGAVVTHSVTTCTKGDDAVNGCVVALWAVWSVNGFTARAAELPHDFLKVVARRLTNEIREVGAVVYRYSDKPPATIEWG